MERETSRISPKVLGVGIVTGIVATLLASCILLFFRRRNERNVLHRRQEYQRDIEKESPTETTQNHQDGRNQPGSQLQPIPSLPQEFRKSGKRMLSPVAKRSKRQWRVVEGRLLSVRPAKDISSG